MGFKYAACTFVIEQTSKKTKLYQLANAWPLNKMENSRQMKSLPSCKEVCFDTETQQKDKNKMGENHSFNKK